MPGLEDRYLVTYIINEKDDPVLALTYAITI